VIGHLLVQAEATEPALSQVQMNFVTKPPFRPDAHTISDHQHPYDQL